MKKWIFLICVLTLLPFSPARSDELTIQPQKDNSLFEDDLGRWSNGSGQYLFMGRTGGDNGLDRLLRRTVLTFDLSQIPPGSVVDSVELRLFINQVPFGATDGRSDVHRLVSNWGEGASNAHGPEGQGISAQSGDATWIHTYFDSNEWDVAGGDFLPDSSQTSFYGSSSEPLVFSSSDALVADVQNWVDSPATNFGWIILGDEQTVQNARRMHSRENADSLNGPRLRVEFTPLVASPVSVPTNTLAGLVLMILTLVLAIPAWRIHSRS